MDRSFVRGCLLLLLTGLYPLAAAGADFQTPAISPQQLHDRQQGADRLLVVDVRNPAEFRVGHLPGAVNLPEPEIADHLEALAGQRGVVLYCIAGTRTKLAEQTLLDHDIPNVFHLQGGLTGWLDRRYPIEKGAGRDLVHSVGNGR